VDARVLAEPRPQDLPGLARSRRPWIVAARAPAGARAPAPRRASTADHLAGRVRRHGADRPRPPARGPPGSAASSALGDVVLTGAPRAGDPRQLGGLARGPRGAPPRASALSGAGAGGPHLARPTPATALHHPRPHRPPGRPPGRQQGRRSSSVGRQPVSFGTALVFAPMDVVNPFSAATIDTEYKPGVDAVRLDGFFGHRRQGHRGRRLGGGPDPHDRTATRRWGRSDVVDGRLRPGHGSASPTWSASRALVRGDRRRAAWRSSSSAGPVGLHGDATLTLTSRGGRRRRPLRPGGARRRRPPHLEDDGRRASSTSRRTGARRPRPATSPSRVGAPVHARRAVDDGPRLRRAHGGSQELTPLVAGSAAVVANLLDPSALVAPGLSISAADDVTVGLGGYLAVGARPDAVSRRASTPRRSQVAPPTTRGAGGAR
jgi:hypothetical protein